MARRLVSLILVLSLLACPFLCETGQCAPAARPGGEGRAATSPNCPHCRAPSDPPSPAKPTPGSPCDCKGLCNGICGGALVQKEQAPPAPDETSSPLPAPHAEAPVGPHLPSPRTNHTPPLSAHSLSGRALRTLHASFLC